MSQLASGWVTDRNLVNKYHYHKTYLILCGVVNLLSPLATSYILLMVYAIFFAIFCGGYMALLLPVLVSTGKMNKTAITYISKAKMEALDPSRAEISKLKNST